MRVEKVVEWYPERRSWHLGYIAWHGHVRYGEALEWADARDGMGMGKDPDAWEGWPRMLKQLGETVEKVCPP